MQPFCVDYVAQVLNSRHHELALAEFPLDPSFCHSLEYLSEVVEIAPVTRARHQIVIEVDDNMIEEFEQGFHLPLED